ncbi:hypothetical protein VKT23_011535 [Stygiomarasmius scandens]|uniref:Uncharacterized protein n=1 Tax=Marasmiellus scandens TaxID=2682957 RepID=A0ABR1J8H8_9AGAR
MSEPSTSIDKPPKDPEVIGFYSRHSAGITESLSRYKRKWYLTYSRPYGMVDPPGTRIVCSLNTPDETVSEEYARRHFWLNPDMPGAPYKPDDPDYATQKWISSPIHILLDAEPSVARLTGRTRAQKSRVYGEGDKEILCFEVEVTIPDEVLLRQCYYCLAWEGEGPGKRWKPCGDDMFWCPMCESNGSLASSFSTTFEKLKRDTLMPLFNRYCFPRNNLYS